MTTKSKKLIVALMVATSLTLPIFAQSLQSSIEVALKKSDTIKSLEINKQQSLLTVELSNVDREVSYAVAPYVSSTVEDSSTSTYSLSPNASHLVYINIPGSYEPTTSGAATDDTNVNFDLNSTIVFSDNETYYSTSPTLSVDHTFLFGEYDTDSKDLNEQVNLLSIEKTYRQGIISFKENLLNLFKAFNTNAKNIEATENSIKLSEKNISDKLALDFYNDTSVTYKSDMATLQNLKNTLANLNSQKEAMLTQYKNYTGEDYVGIDTVEVPFLEIPSNTNDSLSVQIAQLNLQIAQNDVDEVNKSKDRSSAKLSGSLSTTQSDYGVLSDNYYSYDYSSYTGTVGLDYGTDNLSFNGSVSLTSENSDSSLTIGLGGRWTNDTSTRVDLIESKKSSNNLISAQNTLSNVLLTSSYDKINAQSEIDSWNFKYSQIQDSLKIAQDNIELDQQMFDLGLKNQQEVDASIFNLSQLKYDELDVLLDGWITELTIESLAL